VGSHLTLLEDLLAPFLADLGLVLTGKRVLSDEVPRSHEIAALVGAFNGTEVAEISVRPELADLEDSIATVGRVLAPDQHFLHHVPHDAMRILDFEDPIAAVRALVLPGLPNVHTLPAETALARGLILGDGDCEAYALHWIF